MRKFKFILYFLVAVSLFSCEKEERIAGFEDVEETSIYDYILENEEDYSSFLAILKKGGLDKTLSGYNPHGENYTLFLPDNEAVNQFINSNSQFSSLDELLNDTEYAAEFARYHVLNKAIHTSNFPFGAFTDQTLSEDFLTVSFIIEPDTAYYKINNQAAVKYPNIEVSNGFIHLIENALTPISFTTYDWLVLNSKYSIFREAAELTGFDSRLDINMKENDTIQGITLFVESNTVYNEFDIHSLDDLISKISPDDNDYTSVLNPLYNFVGYHILTGSLFIDDFEGNNTNYSTLSDVPLRINGTGIDFAINETKEIFDTIVVDGDTTFVDYIGFIYDESNVLTQTGAVHMIDKLMKQQVPSRVTVSFQFFEEPLFNPFRLTPGTYLLEDPEKFTVIDWSGPDLSFVELGDQESSAWGADYLEIDGDFQISYHLPRIVQGKYELYIGVERFNSENAVIEVYVDGTKIGGFFDLTSGGSANAPFRRVLVGTVDFNAYRTHTIELRSLIPGRLLWDYVQFIPVF
jgi:uncharacterized surface protein with fasciclin (FAS1) repeats